MKKPSFTLSMICLFLAAGVSLKAQTVEIIKGSLLPAGASDTIDVADTNVTYQISATGATISNINWFTRGELSIIGPTNQPTVTVASSPVSGQFQAGFGKGRLFVSYTDDSISAICGPQRRQLDIFKKFGSQDIANIIGNSCVISDDTVTYSINPLVSVNLNAEIGIDRYKWTVPSGWDILFYSGDSSSITFRVGAISGSDTLKADIGLANFADGFEYTLPLQLGVDEPVFDIAPPVCLSLDSSQFVVDLAAVQGVTYTWGFGTGTNWSFAQGTGPNDERIVVSVDNGPGELTLLIEGGCDQPLDTTFVVRRQFGTGNSIDGNECVNQNDLLTYSITNSNAEVQWILPGGWNFANFNRNQSTVDLVSGTTGGILKAVSANCGNDTISFPVNVIPLTPETPQGDPCLPSGFSGNVTYTVPPVQNASSYTWTFPASFVPNTLNTTDPSATVTANVFAGTQNVTVRANGCQNSGVSSLEIAYEPDVPTNLTGITCIALNELNNFFTYSVDNQADVTFQWELPTENWSFAPGSNQTGNSISVTPNGDTTASNLFIRVAAIGCDTTVKSSLPIFLEGNAGFEFSISQFPGSNIYQVTASPPFNFNNADQITWLLNDSIVQTGGAFYGQTVCDPGQLKVEIIDQEFCINATATFDIVCSAAAARLSAQPLEQVDGPAGADFNVTPNPVEDVVTLTLPRTSTAFSIILFGPGGRQLMTKQTSERIDRIDMRDLKEGVYMLIAHDGENRFFKRILKE